MKLVGGGSEDPVVREGSDWEGVARAKDLKPDEAAVPGPRKTVLHWKEVWSPQLCPLEAVRTKRSESMHCI